ncbi:tetratricopeptide repeat protein [Saccharophagus degradans]|uniref:tetratricopeptide repeat protein n=1 Tax=Saccharophagus degradans TaxID=86304 RepID=UPI002477CC6A|nr:tetratricopeptide repeat protein [Saccharophagus degradans]WGO99474.1 tetratricopeptide repeat protein [Saccharophagus degradans]
MKYIFLTFIVFLHVSCASTNLYQQINWDANIDIDAERYSEAKKKYLIVLERARKAGDKEYVAIAQYGLGRANGYLCDFDEAANWFIKSIKERENLPDNQYAYITQNKLELARLYKAFGEFTLANELFEESIKRLDKIDILNEDPIGYVLVLEDYKSSLEGVGNSTKAALVNKTIESIYSSYPGVEPKFVAKQYSEQCL